MAINGLKILFLGTIGSYLFFTKSLGLFGAIVGIILIVIGSLYASQTDIKLQELIDSATVQNANNKGDLE